MLKRRACLIVNANSSGSASDLSRGTDLLSRAGFQLEVVRTRDPDDVSRVIDERRDQIDLVVIGGGDGSLNCAAVPIRAAKLPLGILPLGTANDLARTLGVPTDIEGACRVIAEGYQTWIDLGTVNEKPFFNAASVGTAARLSRRLDTGTKRRWGVLGYPLTLLEVLKDPPAFRVEILHDGRRTHVNAMQVTVGNGRFYGGGMVVHEEATIDDGRLDLYALKPHFHACPSAGAAPRQSAAICCAV